MGGASLPSLNWAALGPRRRPTGCGAGESGPGALPPRRLESGREGGATRCLGASAERWVADRAGAAQPPARVRLRR